MTSFTLTAEQKALMPSDADVAAYEENGYYVAKEGVLSDQRATGGSSISEK